MYLLTCCYIVLTYVHILLSSYPTSILTDGNEQSRELANANNTIGLYPYNPMQCTTRTDKTTAASGHDKTEKSSSNAADSLTANGTSDGPEVRFQEPVSKTEEGDKSLDKQEDMDISDKSDSRCTSRASTKKSIDMDCSMTSDEEGKHSVFIFCYLRI